MMVGLLVKRRPLINQKVNKKRIGKKEYKVKNVVKRINKKGCDEKNQVTY